MLYSGYTFLLDHAWSRLELCSETLMTLIPFKVASETGLPVLVGYGKIYITRMHSSRMRTNHWLTVSRHIMEGYADHPPPGHTHTGHSHWTQRHLPGQTTSWTYHSILDTSLTLDTTPPGHILPMNRQTLVKTLPSPILHMRSVTSFYHTFGCPIMYTEMNSQCYFVH